MKALNLAVNAKVANEETIKLMLAKANAQMLSLASKVPAALDDERPASGHCSDNRS